MSGYDLLSWNLPKLSGRMLSITASVAANPLAQSLFLGRLLENGGIPKLRKLQFTEGPTFLPLVIPPEHATEMMELPQETPTEDRPPRDCVPFTLIRDFALAYRQGTLTPIEAAEQVIQAISKSERTSPPMHAFSASLTDDIRKQAKDSAERLKLGQPRSFIEGVPVAVKEELDVVPYPTTVGTKFLGSLPARQDSYVASRLREAGALLVGKTNMHEIGIATNGENIHHGRIANPYDLQRDPGG